MQSKTLYSKCFNRTLFVRNLTRFWPLWAVYAAMWLMMVPVDQFVTAFGSYGGHHTQQEVLLRLSRGMMSVSISAGLAMAVIFGVLFAMALFSYLMTPRSQGMFHSFPIRREGLFWTNYITGVVVIVAVPLVSFILAALVQLVAGAVNWYVLGVSFFCIVGQMLFFYSFAVFCTMFTGQILAIPVFYGILNGLAYAFCWVVQEFASAFYYGYQTGRMPEWVQWLTPVFKLSDSIYRDDIYNMDAIVGVEITGLGVLGIYVVVAVVLTGVALLIYGRRPSEHTGDTVAISWAKPLFLYGVAICAALSFGQGLYQLVWKQLFGNGEVFLPAMLVCMVLTGLVGYFGASMLMQKSFRVIRSGWKGAAVLTAGLVVFAVCGQMDVLGVESRVPNLAEVESLNFSIGGNNYVSGEIDDSETMAVFIQAHQAVLEEKDSLRYDSNYRYSYETEEITSPEEWQYGQLGLTYQLKNGKSLRRNYDMWILSSDANREGSAIQQLSVLATAPTVQRSNLLKNPIWRITGGELSWTREYENNEYVPIYSEQAQQIYDAMVRDIEAGHFGKTIFLPDQEWRKQVYRNNLELYYLTAEIDEQGNVSSPAEDRNHSMSLDFSIHCTELIQTLKELDIANESTPLQTVGDVEQIMEKQAALQAEYASVG